MRFKITDNFYLDEFIDETTYNRFKDKSQRYIRKENIRAVQYLRSMTGLPITINNWYKGGGYGESGLRDINTQTGARYSAHKFGAATDLKISDLTSFEMFDIVKKYEEELIELGITRVEHPEYTKGKHRDWLHLDSLYTGEDKLKIIKP